MSKFLKTIVIVLSTVGSSSFAKPVNSGRIGVRLDCLTEMNRDKGVTQPCFSISGLRFIYNDQVSKNVSAQLRFDPFASLDGYQGPDRSSSPLVKDSDFVAIDHYSLVWSPRDHLRIALEEFDSAAKIPDQSDLPSASSLTARPWGQTALTVTYDLSLLTGANVKLIAGNGEGENGENMDPQQYFGFMANAKILPGINILLGASQDGNNVGSAAYEWKINRFESACQFDRSTTPSQGFSTQRLAIALELDGEWSLARGLKAAIGWQRNVLSDMSESESAFPSLSEQASCDKLSSDDLVVEDPAGESANSVQNRVLGVSASYRILDKYFFGFDYQNRTIDSGSVDIFESCNGFEQLNCTAKGESKNILSQTAVTVGGGLDLDEELKLTAEYHQRSYDGSYTQFYYANRDNKADDTTESFNFRIAFNWD